MWVPEAAGMRSWYGVALSDDGSRKAAGSSDGLYLQGDFGSPRLKDAGATPSSSCTSDAAVADPANWCRAPS